MNAAQLRAVAVGFHKIADDAYVVFRTLEGWQAPQGVIDEAHRVATRARAFATRCELESHKLDQQAAV